MLSFYTNPMSRGRIARWMLEETGQPYRAEVLEYGAAMKSPQYLAINPMGKGPAIVHGGVVVTESVYAIPGLGRLTVDAVLARDFPTIQGVILFFSFVYVFVTLLVDLSYVFFDPRIRY